MRLRALLAALAGALATASGASPRRLARSRSSAATPVSPPPPTG
ncbi:hypothetical protein ONA70_05245 [Micromonospora yasonensis]|nr:hypothetical protein [Micromonospora yasonensis]MCW3839499.1 hypothetical protein [Micromonospora yasonensis]